MKGDILMLEGETIATGAPRKCPDCEVRLKLKILHSNAGYYIGTLCDCGPYSRESGYFRSYKAAREELEEEKSW